jgi:uncharacterized protein with PIN domain
MQDKIISCIQCNEPFLFSAEESKRFSALGFDEPTRCPECRRKKSKGTKFEDNWKDKGRKKNSRRKNKGNFNDHI